LKFESNLNPGYIPSRPARTVMRHARQVNMRRCLGLAASSPSRFPLHYKSPDATSLFPFFSGGKILPSPLLPVNSLATARPDAPCPSPSHHVGLRSCPHASRGHHVLRAAWNHRNLHFPHHRPPPLCSTASPSMVTTTGSHLYPQSAVPNAYPILCVAAGP
jgi:hypothetical protein